MTASKIRFGAVGVGVLLVVLYFTGRLAGETSPCTGYQCFELFNACRPTSLIVEDLPERAAEIGLTKERIQTAAESRLRAARLYHPSSPSLESPSYLYVNVHVVGQAFSISVGYRRWLHNEEFDLGGIASTWHTGATGTHGGDAGYILQTLSEHLDLFIVEYLRANEGACGGP